MSAATSLFHEASLETEIEARGFATLPLLSEDECRALARSYDDDARFRKTVVMARHGFGKGEYKYFADPLPPFVQALRERLYARLAPIANALWARLGEETRFPATLAEFSELSRQHGQALPTPLVLRYVPGDFNCLHQDLYGDVWFPLQVAVLLDEPARDFEGGEFVLVEQRPRMQSRPVVVPLHQGEGVVFPCHRFPRKAQGASPVRYYRTTWKHGVSEILRGRRHTLGIIFHDART